MLLDLKNRENLKFWIGRTACHCVKFQSGKFIEFDEPAIESAVTWLQDLYGKVYSSDDRCCLMALWNGYINTETKIPEELRLTFKNEGITE